MQTSLSQLVVVVAVVFFRAFLAEVGKKVMLQNSLLQSKHTHHSNYGMQKADLICFVNCSEMHQLSIVLEVLTVTAWHASVWKRKDRVKKILLQGSTQP